MTGHYPTYAAAATRVDRLVRDLGCWPGIVTHPDGSCDLTCDPEGASR